LKNKKADYAEHHKSAGTSLSLQNDVLCNRLWNSKTGSVSISAPANRTKGGGAVGTNEMSAPCRGYPDV